MSKINENLINYVETSNGKRKDIVTQLVYIGMSELEAMYLIDELKGEDYP